MKKAVCLLVAFLLLVPFLSACRDTAKPPNGGKPEEDLAPLAAAVYTDLNDVRDVAVANNTAFLLFSDWLASLDLATGDKVDLAKVDNGTVAAVFDENLYVYANNNILQFTITGELEKTIPCTFTPVDADKMAVFGDTLLLAYLFKNDAGDEESALHKVNLATGVCEAVPPSFKGNDGFSKIASLDFVDAETAVIISLSSASLFGFVKAYYFHLPTEQVKSEHILPTGPICSFHPMENAVYYTQNLTRFRKYTIESDVDTLIGRMDESLWEDAGLEGVFAARMFITSGNAVLWDDFNAALSVTPVVGESPPLVVYAPENMPLLRLEAVVALYEEAFMQPVHVTTFNEERYVDQLRIRLLDQDESFDIYILNEPEKDNFLDRILHYNLYEPLDDYTTLTESFAGMTSGFRAMMSDQDRLFGVPYSLLMMPYMAQEELPFPLTTLDDLWTLCKVLIAEGGSRVVIADPHAMLFWLRDFTQQSLAEGSVDKAALTALLTNIQNYAAAGVLFDETFAKPALLQNYFFNFSHFILGDATQHLSGALLPRPSPDGTTYHSLQGVLLVNPYSDQKPEAAAFLALLSGAEVATRRDVLRDILLPADVSRHESFMLWSENQKEALSYLPELLENAAVYTFDTTAFTAFLRDNIMRGIIDGTLPPAAAADQIAVHLHYTYFE